MKWRNLMWGKRLRPDEAGVEDALAQRHDAQQRLDQATEIERRAEMLMESNGFAEAWERTMRRRLAR
ncbi:hypothetical protein P5W11_09380 [Mycobacteroides abscessus subsp. bolletii]|uniref:hypothetical protein n=1 Tax=Mycobacteroides abscessus TaxID=36809 RepID=UPI00266C78AB|nr:hypothetical protein [Mycobacteroides abscessus]MDO3068421.1 hypothetical protein [Mycobacteroides abscessus subsp. bolletii]